MEQPPLLGKDMEQASSVGRNRGHSHQSFAMEEDDHRMLCSHEKKRKCEECLYQSVKYMSLESKICGRYSSDAKVKQPTNAMPSIRLHFVLHQAALNSQVNQEKMREFEDGLNSKTVELNANITLLLDKFSSIQDRISETEHCLSQLKLQDENVNNDNQQGWTQECELKNISKSLVKLENSLAESELTSQLFEATNYDGNMMWKIDDVECRMKQAVTGDVTVLHSAPCFTSRYGYKFCGRLYLNGDGMGRCTHLSLFIVLMKSDYDNLLEWPFTKRVSFCLINQEDQSKSIQESFVGDRFSSSFQKPVKELNIASGCPLFIALKELKNGGFIKDNSIFIRIRVH